ncbi:Predicted arabinose efflux permease, MFS family [Saccharopolyspora shandongensis]|uniref:Predicted arabinose efflux permease, MFS family n=1 Tax=Saccharopolyspora shandongensis TaxID=418495 RepID=A0A1H2XUG7_9PSEU|nr:MFS transporter [Saccharopolyspora shandongensis]SDW96104.1 Predicted arabinose efflux permease, MFS family [Saccharopolyspora shandongensis]
MPEVATDRRPVAARLAVATLFLVNGASFASVVPRYPELKDALALSNAALGTAIAALPLGSLVAGLLAGPILARWRSSVVAVGCSVLLAADLVVIGLVGRWWQLAAAFFLAGAMDAIVDVAMNAHGLRVQRRYGRSIVNSFHGMWSVGAIIGGAAGSLAAGAALPLPAHLAAAAVVLAAAAVVCARFLLPGRDDAERTSGHRGRPRFKLLLALLALGALCAAAALVEDTAASWGAVYLRDSLDAAPVLAGMAFVALQAAQTVGRLTGDRLVDRFGNRAVARIGGVAVLLGVGSALVWPSVPSTLAGFALAGWGVATIIPAGFHAADELPGLPGGTGIAVVGWVYRLGILAGPPVVGLLADAISLRLGLVVVPFAGVLIVLLASRLPSRAAAPNGCSAAEPR